MSIRPEKLHTEKPWMSTAPPWRCQLQRPLSRMVPQPFGKMWGFGADGGLFAVPREGPGGFRKDEKTIPDRGDDSREVREASPGGTGAAFEQGVTREQHRVGGVMEAASSRRVPWGVNHLEGRAAGRQCHPISQASVRRPVGVDVTPEHEIVGMDPDRGIQGVSQ